MVNTIFVEKDTTLILNNCEFSLEYEFGELDENVNPYIFPSQTDK